ncbi:MAG TPA: hypothetical protein VFF76_05040 [Holophagaceae bacterium]|jgi:hypothetical protein|nr:hypothetical protein [Holophagaceae bacterium]
MNGRIEAWGKSNPIKVGLIFLVIALLLPKTFSLITREALSTVSLLSNLPFKHLSIFLYYQPEIQILILFAIGLLVLILLYTTLVIPLEIKLLRNRIELKFSSEQKRVLRETQKKHKETLKTVGLSPIQRNRVTAQMDRCISRIELINRIRLRILAHNRNIRTRIKVMPYFILIFLLLETIITIDYSIITAKHLNATKLIVKINCLSGKEKFESIHDLELVDDKQKWDALNKKLNSLLNID